MTDNRVAPDVGVMRPPTGTAHFSNAAGTANFTNAAGTATARPVTRAPLWQHVGGTLLLATGLLLTGCSNNASGPRGSTLRVYAADLAGAAKVCTVPTVDPTAGGSSEVAMKVANDGGWCGIPVHQDGPKPYEAGLLVTRPSHGTVLIHEVGDETRIDYTPDRGFAGSDTFSVKLIPGNATVPVRVTVIPRQT